MEKDRRKLYTAFISSVYENLKDERKEVIDCLLDYKVFPLCMEHFVTCTNQNFNEIKDLIDDTDFMVLILGDRYGSTDENGVSWTEREYEYALESEVDVLAIVCDELVELREKRRSNPDSLNCEEKKQLAFTDKISYAVPVSDKHSIASIVGQFFAGRDLSRYSGWTRASNVMRNSNKLERWRKNNKVYDLSGTWYHFHVSPQDPQYIRIGTVHIIQKFDPDNYRQLKFNGINYNCTYNAETDILRPEVMKSTNWKGEYNIDDDGTMFGIFQARRGFRGAFNDQIVDNGLRRGIHDFTIFNEDKKFETDYFSGEFHDEAPSPKFGYIYIFRTQNARDEYIKTNYSDTLQFIANKH